VQFVAFIDIQIRQAAPGRAIPAGTRKESVMSGSQTRFEPHRLFLSFQGFLVTAALVIGKPEPKIGLGEIMLESDSLPALFDHIVEKTQPRIGHAEIVVGLCKFWLEPKS